MALKKHSSRGLSLIAAFKLFKGFALLAVAIGALKLLHKDVASEVERWINYLRVDPHNHLIDKLLAKLGLLDDRKLKELSVGTFFYSALLLTEGVGLALRKRWAEYLTIVSTASLLPLEVLEIARRVNFARIALFLVNVAVVVYLIVEVRKKQNVEQLP
jgi:uncharacterized membrane protein (DUF2068 family)